MRPMKREQFNRNDEKLDKEVQALGRAYGLLRTQGATMAIMRDEFLQLSTVEQASRASHRIVLLVALITAMSAKASAARGNEIIFLLGTDDHLPKSLRAAAEAAAQAVEPQATPARAAKRPRRH